MARLTTDRNDPDLTHGVDTETTPQAKAYLISEVGEFIRPIRRRYVHYVCKSATTMSDKLAETYARDPNFYGATYCVSCQKHLPVSEFNWDDGSVLGS